MRFEGLLKPQRRGEVSQMEAAKPLGTERRFRR